MAENLTSPADFIASKQKSAKQAVNVNLLPPSAFETKIPQADPWKDYAKATEEVNRLRLENIKLKEAQIAQPKVKPVVHLQEAVQTSQSGTCKYSGRKDDLRYIDELINKQACEVTDLKNELRNIKCQHREEISEMERQLTMKEREYTHNITSLESELKSAESRYENQVDRLSRDHQCETEDLNGALDKLQQELSEVRIKSGQRVEDLEVKYGELKQTSEEKCRSMMLDIRSKETLIENQSQQISQLKMYIGEAENLPKAADIVRKEKDALSKKLKTYETEHESLSSTVQLLNIRLNSMNEVLKLQETELSKSSTDIEKTKHEGLLLTRWREKVFALMVQQKSAEICKSKDKSNWKSKVRDLEQRIASLQNHNDQLSHTVSDKDAQLTMERNKNMQLQGELAEAQQLALSLDDRLQETAQNVHTLQEFAASIWLKYQDNLEIVNTAMASLKAYGQRISFASGRLEMLQGLFARREAMLKLKADKSVVPEKDTTEEKIETPDYGDDSSVLRLELERVTRERDNLASQIKQDSLTWDDKVKDIHKQYEDEINSLQLQVDDHRITIEDKTQACSELSEKLELCQTDLDDACQTIEELKTTIAKHEMDIHQMLEDQKQEVDHQCAERVADMDRQLNDAKREHAKAVVALRQLERQSGRERERLQDQIQTAEEHYKRQIEALQAQAKTLEKERNLMMATLRQEGLIGRLKSERGEPITADWDREEEPVTVRSGELTSPRETTTATQPEIPDTEEPMTAVLEDLQSLTDAVLKDNSDSGSDGES